MKSFCTIALNDKHYIIASIHPNIEIRRYEVACINELYARQQRPNVHLNKIKKLKQKKIY
jgi:hypothetical protein